MINAGITQLKHNKSALNPMKNPHVLVQLTFPMASSTGPRPKLHTVGGVAFHLLRSQVPVGAAQCTLRPLQPPWEFTVLDSIGIWNIVAFHSTGILWSIVEIYGNMLEIQWKIMVLPLQSKG